LIGAPDTILPHIRQIGRGDDVTMIFNAAGFWEMQP
jgi:hypothetical protein